LSCHERGLCDSLFEIRRNMVVIMSGGSPSRACGSARKMAASRYRSISPIGNCVTFVTCRTRNPNR
jgi:hypothetical protein